MTDFWKLPTFKSPHKTRTAFSSRCLLKFKIKFGGLQWWIWRRTHSNKCLKHCTMHCMFTASKRGWRGQVSADRPCRLLRRVSDRTRCCRKQCNTFQCRVKTQQAFLIFHCLIDTVDIITRAVRHATCDTLAYFSNQMRGEWTGRGQITLHENIFKFMLVYLVFFSSFMISVTKTKHACTRFERFLGIPCMIYLYLSVLQWKLMTMNKVDCNVYIFSLNSLYIHTWFTRKAKHNREQFENSNKCTKNTEPRWVQS